MIARSAAFCLAWSQVSHGQMLSDFSLEDEEEDEQDEDDEEDEEDDAGDGCVRRVVAYPP